jgi:cellulose synthase/poly-beta-1,6-N-acetylglucosamine synthase-like glycosyltransferase
VITELIFSIITFLVIVYIAILMLIYKFAHKAPNVRKNQNYQPLVSIVIPTMNEEKIIEKRLQNILEMDYPREKLEVVFVDNSNDATPQIIKNYQKNYPFIKLLKQQKQGFNNALNQGYSAANGEIVIKSDCTAFPLPDALTNIVSNFADGNIGAVCGVHIFPEDKESVEKEFKDIQYKIQQAETYLHSSLVSHGAFGAYRKDLIPKLREEITADDSEVVINVVRHGYRAVVDSNVKCIEKEPQSFRERIEQKNRRAAGVIRVILSNLDILFNRKYGAFGLIIFPIEFFILILTPILVFLVFVLLVCMAVIAWSLIPIFVILLSLITTFICVKLSVRAKAIFDTYLSCFMGLFQAFRKRITWK